MEYRSAHTLRVSYRRPLFPSHKHYELLIYGSSRTYPDEDEGEDVREGYDPDEIQPDANESDDDHGNTKASAPSSSRVAPATEEEDQERNVWRASP